MPIKNKLSWNSDNRAEKKFWVYNRLQELNSNEFGAANKNIEEIVRWQKHKQRSGIVAEGLVTSWGNRIAKAPDNQEEYRNWENKIWKSSRLRFRWWLNN